MPGFFVTATGTDVGKTYVTAGLIRAGLRAGRAMDALKPVMSGYDDMAPAESDAGRLLAALGRPINPATIAGIAPWRFAAPLSPDIAAAREGRSLDFAAISTWCRRALRPDAICLIEGVGGVMVPLDGTHTVLDLMDALVLPVVLVSSTGLGAISHCLTARATLVQRGLAIPLIVLNETPGSTVPSEDTRKTLTQFCGDSRIAILERNAADAAFDTLLSGLLVRS